MTVVSTGTCPTERAARYGKQLTNHMSRRFGGGWVTEEASGRIQLVDAYADVVAGQDELVITLTSDNPELAQRFEAVIERHLLKFGEKDRLEMSWTRSSDSGAQE